jgi:protein TonB
MEERLEPPPDPFARVCALGERRSLAGTAAGLVLAALSHFAAVLLGLFGMFQGTRALAATPQELTIDIVTAPEPPPAPPEPPPAPPQAEPPPDPAEPDPPDPPEPPAPNEKEDPYEDLDRPPPPAEAAKVLTAPSDPEQPPAPSDTTFASGEGTGRSVGLVAGDGTGNRTTYDPRAQVGNKPIKRLNDWKSSSQQGYPDLTRAASPFYGVDSGCAYPSGADGEVAVVTVIVTVGADGKALHVEVLDDPGMGFGRAARTCAMRHPYRAGRDASGKPVVSKTPPVRVRFTR